MKPDIEFLQATDVPYLHHEQVHLYGGDSGLRDPALLESAVAQPAATFDGKYLHSFPHEMAAAYLFHLVGNHPFVDGNKRAGVVAALVFLDLNGYETDAKRGEVYDLTIGVARGQIGKAEVAQWFQDHTWPREADS